MDILPGAAGLMILPFLFMGLFGLLSLAFWIWMLVDCITKEPSTGNDKIIWVVVIVLLHALGAIIYFFARRPTRIQMYGQ